MMITFMTKVWFSYALLSMSIFSLQDFQNTFNILQILNYIWHFLILKLIVFEFLWGTTKLMSIHFRWFSTNWCTHLKRLRWRGRLDHPPRWWRPCTTSPGRWTRTRSRSQRRSWQLPCGRWCGPRAPGSPSWRPERAGPPCGPWRAWGRLRCTCAGEGWCCSRGLVQAELEVSGTSRLSDLRRKVF